MSCKIIEMCKFSWQTSAVQRVVQGLGGLDELNTQLNGKPYSWQTGSPKIVGLIEKVNDAVRTVKDGFQEEFFGGVGLIKA